MQVALGMAGLGRAGHGGAGRCAARQGFLDMEILIHATGITPLLLNKFTDEAAIMASGGTRGASAGAERKTPLDICESKLYRGLDGGLIIPQPNLLRSLVDGGRFHKVGKKQVTTKEESMMFACVDIEDAEIPLIHKAPWKVDTRPVVIPSTKGRILAHRPMFDDWRLEFTVQLDPSILGPGIFRKIVDDAGKRIGLGDFRPARKGPYGKYRVDHWQIVEQEVREAA
jgi:hypothetical protein